MLMTWTTDILSKNPNFCKSPAFLPALQQNPLIGNFAQLTKFFTLITTKSSEMK